MDERYIFTNGWTMRRQDGFPYWWILRDGSGREVDKDKYRHDLMPRHRLVVQRHDEPTLNPSQP